MITAERYHDISCGHRVHGHESKCAMLHGHNYRITFVCAPMEGPDMLDSVGRVLDFSVIKERLCMWLEDNWDHKFLAWDEDEYMKAIAEAISGRASLPSAEASSMLIDSLVWVPFNPTAENMAQYLLRVVGPARLRDTGVRLASVMVEETRKCGATAY